MKYYILFQRNFYYLKNILEYHYYKITSLEIFINLFFDTIFIFSKLDEILLLLVSIFVKLDEILSSRSTKLLFMDIKFIFL